MKVLSVIFTFILTFQLAYASATVCDHIGQCGQKVESTMVDMDMKDCPHHSSSNDEDKKEERSDETQSPCKCCAVISLDFQINPNTKILSAISFIEFDFKEASVEAFHQSFLRPPIA